MQFTGFHRSPSTLLAVIGLSLSLASTAAQAQLRVANWNVTDYSSGRAVEFRNALFGTAPASGVLVPNLRFWPDIVLAQEIREATGAANFLAILNGAAAAGFTGAPTDWAMTPYVATPVNPGSNPPQVMYYRTSKVTLLSQAGVPAPSTVKVLRVGTTGSASTYGDTGSCADCPPRDTHRYQVRLVGYPSGVASELYLYSAHYKAGPDTSDQARRTPESDRLRADSNALPLNSNFLIGADFNVQSSSQAAYVNLLTSGSNAAGRFIDPISTPGSWENNNSFRFVHTQEPSTEMDSRHDQILIGPTLRAVGGLDYIGTTAAYSTTTWNDPNHSYRCWGNDGSTFDTVLKTTGNTMVGASIAASLIATVEGNGHLPVYLDLRVPAKINAPASINFGTVDQNSLATVTITIRNGDALVSGSDPHFSRFSRDGSSTGFETLSYTLSPSAGFTTPGGTFTRTANLSAGNSHVITMNTSTLGLKNGTLTIASNGVNSPSLLIPITGNVIAVVAALCPGDIAFDDGGLLPPFGPSGGTNNGLTEADYNAFFAGFFDAAAYCDIVADDGSPIGSPGSANNGTTEADYNFFFSVFFDGCPQ